MLSIMVTLGADSLPHVTEYQLKMFTVEQEIYISQSNEQKFQGKSDLFLILDLPPWQLSIGKLNQHVEQRPQVIVPSCQIVIVSVIIVII